jgi:hypothetical protein
MRSDRGSAVKWCSITATMSSCGVDSATQIPPRQVVPGIEAVQLPVEVPTRVQLPVDCAIGLQPMLPPGVGARARRRPSSRRTDPMRRNMRGA